MNKISYKRKLRALSAVLIITSIFVTSAFALPAIGKPFVYDVLSNSLGIFDTDNKQVSTLYFGVTYYIKFPACGWASRFDISVYTDISASSVGFLYFNTSDYNSYISLDAVNSTPGYVYTGGTSFSGLTDVFYFKLNGPSGKSYSLRSLTFGSNDYSVAPVSYHYGTESGSIEATVTKLPVVINPGLQEDSDITYDASYLPALSTYCDFKFPTNTEELTAFACTVFVTGGYRSFSLALIPKNSASTPVIYVPYIISGYPGSYVSVLQVDLSGYTLSAYTGIRLNCIAEPYDIIHFPSSGKWNYRYFVQFQQASFFQEPSALPWYSVVAGWIKGIFDSVGGESKIDDDPAISDVSGGIDNIQTGAQDAIDTALPGVTSDITTISGNLAGGVAFLTRYVTGVFDGMGDIKILFLLPFFIGVLMHIWGRVPNSSAVKSRLRNNKSPSDKPSSGGVKSG